MSLPTGVKDVLRRAAKQSMQPLVKSVAGKSLVPNAVTRPLLSTAYTAHFVARELGEMLWRSAVATPIFLSRCASYGSGVAVDKVPYLLGNPHITLGNDVRISGQITIRAASRGTPELSIGSGVFIGYGTSINIAKRVHIGDFVAIGAGCYIADTEGHSHYNPNRPIWEVPASDDDIAEVIIEDNVQISRNCSILKGVRVGARSVIGAGSVVRSNIPPDSVVMGNPARVVKRMKPTADDDTANR